MQLHEYLEHGNDYSYLVRSFANSVICEKTKVERRVERSAFCVNKALGIQTRPLGGVWFTKF